MNTAMEYLLLSTLSYADFSNEDKGRTIEELFYGEEETRKRIMKNAKSFLSEESRPHLFEFFKETFREWEIYYVDNRTENGRNFYSKASGFYAVVFRKKDSYVISYRGSERYPLEDAYKDFIETDLLLGMGKRPKQFMEGYEVYEDVLAMVKENGETISLTGHSLGGGIAQFVALMADKDGHKVPYTCTWNAVGINKSGIVGVDDFIDFDTSLREVYPFKKEEIGVLLSLKESYLDFLVKDLRKRGYIKDRGNVKVDETTLVTHEVTPEIIEEFVKYTKLDKQISGFSITTRRALFQDQDFVKRLLTLPSLKNNLLDAKMFIDKIKENTAYREVIVNFCHSKDLTVSLFNHVGSVYLIDKEFEEKEVKSSSFFKNIFLFTKSVKDYHFENVFLPFLVTEGDNRGRFSHHLNIDYIVSILRKVIHFGRQEDRELLIRYYKLEEIEKEDVAYFKELLLEGLRRSKDDILYSDQAMEAIEKFETEDLKLTWKRMKDKLVSPYEARDLYDIITFSS